MFWRYRGERASEPPLLYNLKNEYDIDVIKLFRGYRGAGRVNHHYFIMVVYKFAVNANLFISLRVNNQLTISQKSEYHIDVIRLFRGYRGSGASEAPLLYNLKNEYDIDIIRLLGEYRRGGGGVGEAGAGNGASEPPLLYNFKNEYDIDVIRLFREYRGWGFEYHIDGGG